MYVLICILLLIISISFNVKLIIDKKKAELIYSDKNLEIREREIKNISLSNSNEIVYQENLNQISINNLKEINDLKEKHRNDLKNEYDEGIKKGIELSKIEVRVTPIKRLKKQGNIGFRKEVIEIGYSYRLFSNNFPCLDPHDEIIERVEISEINEKFVDLLNEKFNQILDKIPNSNFILTETIESFSSKLLKKKD